MSERSERIIEGRVSREATAGRSEVGAMSERSERIIQGCASREATAECSEVGA